MDYSKLIYIRTDKNGTEIYADPVCKRCQGAGARSEWAYTGSICYECGGTGRANKPKIIKKYTPEYQAKLEARRLARHPQPEILPEPEPEPEPEAPKLPESNWIGTVGDKLEIEVVKEFMISYQTVYGLQLIFIFKDPDGNKLIWKTSAGFPEAVENGKMIKIKATVKDHSEYKGEKQTVLTRVKMIQE